jgi:hypothetical protein
LQNFPRTLGGEEAVRRKKGAAAAPYIRVDLTEAGPLETTASVNPYLTEAVASQTPASVN